VYRPVPDSNGPGAGVIPDQIAGISTGRGKGVDQAWAASWAASASQRSVSMAAMQPDPAAVIAWR